MGEAQRELDMQSHRAHGARIYDYILGGKDNYAVDREAGDAALAGWPSLRTSMRANRAFMHRTARFLVRECGITQFLDIGTGIPTSPNLHEVVQEIVPESRVVYTDNDPIVLAHARALMTSSPQGRTAYIDADMRQPEQILAAPALRDTLDLTRPVGLLLIAIVHFIEDDDEAYRVVRQVVDVLPAGSYLAVSGATDEFDPVPLAEVQRQYNEHGEVMKFRSKERIEGFFTGLDLVEPGVVQAHKWRPNGDLTASVANKDVAMYAGVARKQ